MVYPFSKEKPNGFHKKEDVDILFKKTHTFLYEQEVDYWTAQLAWSIFMDALCKDGMISQRHYDEWLPPFPYGEHLRHEWLFTSNNHRNK